MSKTFLVWTFAIMTSCLAQTLQPLLANDPPQIHWGQIEVSVRAENIAPPSEINVKMDPQVCGQSRKPQSLILGPKGELQNVVVWVEGDRVFGWPQDAAEDAGFIVMNQCEFSPRILIAPPKGKVSFRNLDPILHTLRAHGKLNFPVFKSHPPNLSETSMRFEHPEIVPIICDMHPWMTSYVVVAPHKNYAVTNAQGKATIKKVPDGRFRIKLWHETLGMKELNSEVVLDGNTQQVNFTWNPSSP